MLTDTGSYVWVDREIIRWQEQPCMAVSRIQGTSSADLIGLYICVIRLLLYCGRRRTVGRLRNKNNHLSRRKKGCQFAEMKVTKEIRDHPDYQ